jgi:hypothetical protein
MLAQFQSLYPNGSIISELVQIFQGKYIVRVSLQIEGVTRATGMAGADTIEAAEDQARNRALMLLAVNSAGASLAQSPTPPVNTTNVSSESVSLSNDAFADQKSLTNSIPKSPTPAIETNSNSQNYSYKQPLSNISSATTVKEETKAETLDVLAPHIETVSTPEPEPQPLPEINPSNVTPFTPRNYSPLEDVGSRSGVGKNIRKNEPVNLSDVIAQTDVHIERLGWTKEQGREHLKKTYGKLGRSLLSEEELLDFLNYLKAQPDPIAGF